MDRHDWRLAEIKRLYIDGHIEFDQFEKMIDRALRDQAREELQNKMPIVKLEW